MKKFRIGYALSACSLCLVLTFNIYGQTLNPEDEFLRIRDIAFSGYHAEAELLLLNLLDSFPTYGDARVLLARVSAWQKKYERALVLIEELLAAEPDNGDALEAERDIRRWMAGEQAEDSYVPQAYESETGSGESGNEILAGYWFDTFSQPYTRFWQVWRAGASHMTGHGRVSGVINIGHISSDGFGKTEFQLETEAYPVISPSVYGWLNYAWSPGDYFPRHRVSAELWHNLGSGWVASGGLNYYYFRRNIFITVISVEKYLGAWWLNGRSYFYFKDSGITSSLFLNVRRYFNDTDFLQLTAGTGTAPDEPFDIIIDIERLSAATFRISGHKIIYDRISLRAGVGYSREEFRESVRRNRIDGTISVAYKLQGIR